MTSELEAPGVDGAGGLRVTGIVLAGIALTLLFMVLDFPYDRLAHRIAGQIEASTGARVLLGDVSLGLVRWAPGLEAEGVEIHPQNAERISLTRVGLRPALSLSWFRGNPALALEVESPQGGASGTATFGEAPGYQGQLLDVDLTLLPQDRLGRTLRLEGRADADVSVVLAEAGAEGEVTFEAREGILRHPVLPLPIPYQTLTGEIGLGGEDMARIRSIDLQSPLATGRAKGTVGQAARFANAPLRLSVELTVSGAIQGSLNAQGVQMGDGGEIRVDVTGTPTRPWLDKSALEALQKVFKTLSDPTRVRVLALLEQEELAVQELMDVLGMAQSRVSRHLAILREAGLLRDRRDGTYVFYRFELPEDGPWREGWELVRRTLISDPTHARDRAALSQVMAARADRTRSFFDAVGPEWDALRKVFNDDALRSRALTRLVPPGLRVADVGTGTGILAGELARLGAHVVAIDHSPRMLEAARAKLAAAGITDVDLRAGEAHALPIDDASLDAAFTHMVLHYLPSPGEAIREMARIVRPGGAVVVVDFVRHEHEWMRQELGVSWLGFDAAEVEGWFEQAGLVDAAVETQEARAGARDLPATFIASARRTA